MNYARLEKNGNRAIFLTMMNTAAQFTNIPASTALLSVRLLLP